MLVIRLYPSVLPFYAILLFKYSRLVVKQHEGIKLLDGSFENFVMTRINSIIVVAISYFPNRDIVLLP